MRTSAIKKPDRLARSVALAREFQQNYPVTSTERINLTAEIKHYEVLPPRGKRRK